jgi:Cu/Zn superoxide dismutase
MRRMTKLNVGLFLATLIVFGSGAIVATGGGGHEDKAKSVRAHAVVTGPGVHGLVTFRQERCPGCPTPAGPPFETDDFENFPEPDVEVSAKIDGLTAGPHGLHIHEVGSCDAPGFTTAGGHFDPGPFGSSNPVDANHPFHSGDLPNLLVDKNGTGRLRHTTSRVTLSPGPTSVFDANGSAVIVHLNPDRGLNGVTGASGGPRAACGVIVLDGSDD